VFAAKKLVRKPHLFTLAHNHWFNNSLLFDVSIKAPFDIQDNRLGLGVILVRFYHFLQLLGI
jgi:hypothetical protein